MSDSSADEASESAPERQYKRIKELESELAQAKEQYRLMAASIDIHPGECLPECDSYSHAELCPHVNDAVNFIEMGQELIKAKERICELERKLKNYEPTNLYNGLTIEQWKARAEQAEERIEQLSMPWAKLVKQAESEEGVDSKAWFTRLHKKIDDQKRDINRLREKLERRESEPEEAPYAWVIPGDDNANMNGFIDARIDREGEFTMPLYRRRSSTKQESQS